LSIRTGKVVFREVRVGNAAAEVAASLREIRALAAADAPLAACKTLGSAGQTVIRVTLSLTSHGAGTRTPSAPGSPPARISGDLAGSFLLTPAALLGPGVASCAAGSLLIYAPVHQFGPVTITSHGSWPLRNKATGQVFGHSVVIPRRPYIEPAMALLEGGAWQQEWVDAWQAVLNL
jgi:hypothetical protein